jgi:hypothetical protein
VVTHAAATAEVGKISRARATDGRFIEMKLDCVRDRIAGSWLDEWSQSWLTSGILPLNGG